MNPQSFNTFECQMYVTGRAISLALPVESGPSKIARLEPLAHDKLIEPSFRRLLAAFESIPQPLQSVQV